MQADPLLPGTAATPPQQFQPQLIDHCYSPPAGHLYYIMLALPCQDAGTLLYSDCRQAFHLGVMHASGWPVKDTTGAHQIYVPYHS